MRGRLRVAGYGHPTWLSPWVIGWGCGYCKLCSAVTQSLSDYRRCNVSCSLAEDNARGDGGNKQVGRYKGIRWGEIERWGEDKDTWDRKTEKEEMRERWEEQKAEKIRDGRKGEVGLHRARGRTTRKEDTEKGKERQGKRTRESFFISWDIDPRMLSI